MPNTYACKGVSNPNVPIFPVRVCTLVLFITCFPYSTCIHSFFGSSIPTSFSFLKCFFTLYLLHQDQTSQVSVIVARSRQRTMPQVELP